MRFLCDYDEKSATQMHKQNCAQTRENSQTWGFFLLWSDPDAENHTYYGVHYSVPVGAAPHLRMKRAPVHPLFMAP